MNKGSIRGKGFSIAFREVLGYNQSPIFLRARAAAA
jgi:hypothetical protein